MDYRSALELLGLDASDELTRDRLRRSYLRRLRDCPPERDPDGFRRLREAFESIEPMVRDRAYPVEILYVASDLERAAPRPSTPSPLEPSTPPPPDTPTPTATAEAVAGTDEPPHELTLDALVDELLALLERGQVDPALDLAQRWRDRVFDDHRMIGTGTARRWALTRDLLGVAAALPFSILRAFALGIAANDFAGARPILETYRLRNPRNARDLERHLAKRAKAIYQLVGEMLSDPGPSDPRAGSYRASRLPWTFVLVVIALCTKLAVRCDSPSSSYRPQDIQLSPEALDRLRSQGSPIVLLAHTLERDPQASREQVAAAVAIALAARRSDCRALDQAVAQLWSAANREPAGPTGPVDDLILQISRGVAAQCPDVTGTGSQR